VGRYRRIDHARIAGDEGDGFRHGAEAIGIIALIAIAGQATLPIGRQQAQRIPALGAPGIRHLAALEQHMIDAALAEAAADRQAGVTGADDDGGDVANGSRSCARARRALSSPRR